MFERLMYKNHINEVVDFGVYGVYVNTSALHDYEWKVTSKGNRISAMKYSVQTRKLPVIIMCSTEEEGIEIRNRLFEVFEKDVLSLQHGKVIIGDYYFKCFVTKSTKSDYQKTKRYMSLTLTLSSDFPYWVKESTATYGITGGASEGLDYPFDYAFDYLSSNANTALNNTGFVASNFKMIIYGACSNPTINIAGHTYQVNCNVEAGEYLTIDSTTKKIFVTRNNGSIVNHFNDRNKRFYIFEKIPAGMNEVTWDGDFGFDIILMEERSEPKWT
jgi:phage-related protein